MARHTKIVTIRAKGRDAGKSFVLTEMDADKGERWAFRTLLALSRGGIEVPQGMFDQGWIGLAGLMPYVLVVGLQSMHGAQWAELQPLLDEMMECVKYKPPGVPNDERLYQELFEGASSQIEEISTRMHLRKEVLELHMGFSVAGALSNSGSDSTPSPEAAQSA